MKRVWLTALIVFLFILEGSVVQVLFPTSAGMAGMTAVPRFALVASLLVAMFLGRREGLYYGLAIGFLQDVLYVDVIGLYMMSMMLACYFSGLIVLLFQRSFGMMLVTCVIVLFGHEWLLYILFRLFSLAPQDAQWVLTSQILPTVLLNGLFMLMIYLPVKLLCEPIAAGRSGASIE